METEPSSLHFPSGLSHTLPCPRFLLVSLPPSRSLSPGASLFLSEAGYQPALSLLCSPFSASLVPSPFGFAPALLLSRPSALRSPYSRFLSTLLSRVSPDRTSALRILPRPRRFSSSGSLAPRPFPLPRFAVFGDDLSAPLLRATSLPSLLRRPRLFGMREHAGRHRDRDGRGRGTTRRTKWQSERDRGERGDTAEIKRNAPSARG